MKKLLACILSFMMLMTAMTPALAADYEYEEPVKSAMLPRSTPEEKGISSEYILDTLNAFELADAEIHAMVMSVGGELIFEGYWAPYTREDPHTMFSLTKLFTNAAIGVAVTNGDLSLDDYVVDAFPELSQNASENLKKMQLKHLLTMTNGHGRMISGSELRPLKTSWLEHLMAEPVPYEPGTHYQYNSGCTVISSAMLTRATGMTAHEVLMNTGFGELGMEHFSWDLAPDGFNAGHGGVKITAEDILKVGILYMNGGNWNGTQVLSEDWCNKAIGYEKVIENQGNYAFHWTDEGNGCYAAGGSYGQTLLICPELDLAIAVTAGTNVDIPSILYENLIAPTVADGAERAYDANSAYAAALKRRASTLNLLTTPVYTASPLAEKIDDKVYAAAENEDNIKTLTLNITEDYIDYTTVDDRGTHTIRNGVGAWVKSKTSMTSNNTHHQYQYPIEPVVAYAEWLDDNTLELTWRWPELAFVDTLVLTFADDGSTVSMVRSVNVNSGDLVRPEIIFQ